MKKYALLILLVIGLSGYAVYNYMYKDHRDIAKETAAYEVDAITLAQEFAVEPEKTLSKYLNKTILVNGTVTEIESNAISLSEAVYCTFTEKVPSSISINTPLQIKGRCIGYDELLEVIKIDQSTSNP